MNPFIHLRVRSAYSLAESAVRVDALVERCRLEKMPAVGIADLNNLFGALELAETLSAAGIQPLVGLELSLRHRVGDEEVRARDGSLPSIVLFAQNSDGYKSLLALTSQSYLTREADGKVCVGMNTIAKNAKGVLCLTGGRHGIVNSLIASDLGDDASQLLDELSASFSGRLYVELQRYPDLGDTDELGRGVEESELVAAAVERSLPLVATNTVVFPEATDHSAHDALLCIGHGRYVSEDDRPKASGHQFFSSSVAMRELFADLPEAVENTAEIARRCAFRPRLHPPILPSFAGDAEAEQAELQRQAEDGLRQRLETITPAAPLEAYRQRLSRELSIICKMGFPGYFLIVSDFIKWAKDNDIPVGPGRGSGAGSLVAFALTITNLDPLRFNLLFERFLNPERVSMPDFDIDFCQDRRDEVIQYVRRRYGDDRVAQIITFGKLQARAVLRDVGRVLQMPFGQVDRLCRLVPNNPANPITLQEAVRQEPKFREEEARDDMVGRLLTTAQKLEGLYRHASTHAAGVVIGDRPLKELVPLYKDPKSDMPATQFNMKWVEPAGLVKFDFLGLKTLTVIDKAVAFIRCDDANFSIEEIDLSDNPTFEMLGRGDAIGVFQLESSGMRATLKGLQPDSLEDIIALVSLYRPGPMDNIPMYIDRKSGREPPDYLHPLLEEILKETYGVIIYQEQVMQIAQVLSGYSLGEADLLRRAMGKKKKEEMDKQKVRFIEGASERGVDSEKASSIFELVAKFAGYGFNKSHAAAYALISYQTAYLKANHPAAFLAASMELDAGLTDKLAVFVSEARRINVAVVPPCINRSSTGFSVGQVGVLYALGAIKNVGKEAVQGIVDSRGNGGRFADLFDLAERVDLKKVGKRTIEQLARAGAFDDLVDNRALVFASAELLLRYSSAVRSERQSGQSGLFSDVVTGMGGLARPKLPNVAPWSLFDQLEEERKALGFFLSGHPLSAFSEFLEQDGVASIADVQRAVQDNGAFRGRVAGVVREVVRRRSKSGKPFAWVALSDMSGEYEVTVFSETLASSEDLLDAGERLLVSIAAEKVDGAFRLTAHSMRSLDDAANEAASGSIVATLDDPNSILPLKSALAKLAAEAGVTVATDQLLLRVTASSLAADVDLAVACPGVRPLELQQTLTGVGGVAVTRQPS